MFAVFLHYIENFYEAVKSESIDIEVIEWGARIDSADFSAVRRLFGHRAADIFK